jgi:hypothetical protein
MAAALRMWPRVNLLVPFAICVLNMWARSFFPQVDCNFLAPRKE